MERTLAKWFTDEEIEGLDPDLVDALDDARSIAGVPFVLTSAFRAGDPRSHGRGLAVDIRCSQLGPRYRRHRGLHP
jgi:hypothetical protein